MYSITKTNRESGVAALSRCLSRLGLLVVGIVLSLGLTGCGTTNQKAVTEQLLVSDAVDRAVQSIDFTGLAHEKVYLDTTYIKPLKGAGWVNAEYVESSLRQHLVASYCLLQQTRDDATVVVEPRLGAMGTDAHDVTYGMPQSNVVSTAATFVPNAPTLPVLPEIALGKTAVQFGAAKLAVFAYDRKTGDPIWQSGMRVGKSKSRDIWIMGAGPIQSGTIYASPRFAGERVKLPGQSGGGTTSRSPVDYMAEMTFPRSVDVETNTERIAQEPGEGETEVK